MNKQQVFPALSLRARSLDIPNEAHPNRMPFTGVLTKIDEPSDTAPEGSGGRRILLTMGAATAALDSLLGQGINFNFDGHVPREKVGVIYGSEIVGNEIRISRTIYAADFPEVAAQIKANKDKLGLSFEARGLMTTDPHADPIQIAECVFTGAAILLKDKAAYRTTQIYASSHKDFEMPNIFEKMTVAERAKVAEQMSVEEKRAIIASMTDSLAGIQAKGGGDEKHRTVLSKISAARSLSSRGAVDMEYIDGTLRRHGLMPIEEIAVKPQHEIDQILASAKKFLQFERVAIRGMLHRIGALRA